MSVATPREDTTEPLKGWARYVGSRSPLDVAAFGLTICAVLASWSAITVSATRPLGCSAGTTGTGIAWQQCDYYTSSGFGLVVLVVAYLVPVLLFWASRRKSRRWLLIVGAPLLAVSLVSFIGAVTLAPSALWFAAGVFPGRKTPRILAVIEIVVVVVALGLFGLGVGLLVSLAQSRA